jgi:hypothetical protein
MLKLNPFSQRLLLKILVSVVISLPLFRRLALPECIGAEGVIGRGGEI